MTSKEYGLLSKYLGIVGIIKVLVSRMHHPLTKQKNKNERAPFSLAVVRSAFPVNTVLTKAHVDVCVQTGTKINF